LKQPFAARPLTLRTKPEKTLIQNQTLQVLTPSNLEPASSSPTELAVPPTVATGNMAYSAATEDFYKVLEIDETADDDEIKSNYKRLGKM